MGWAKRNVDLHPRNNSMVDVCPVDRRPVLQRIMETDPLQQGQALASALKKKKKIQKRAGGRPSARIRGQGWVRRITC